MKKNVRILEQEVAELKALLFAVLQKQDEEIWLDSADLKQLFHFSNSTLYRLRKQKIVSYTKIGGRYFYPKSFFNKLLLDNSKEK
jgi:Helix-turn-helix domain